MLQKIGFLPGFNKQVTPTTAEGQWIGGDNVRFRYSTPEKIGGWTQLGEDYLTGAARALHHFNNKDQIKYAAIGTNRILYVYSGGIFYDIHPIKTTETLTNAFKTTYNSATVSLVLPSTTGISAGDILLLDNFTTITGSDYVAADFNDKKFMVTSIESGTELTITMPSVETANPGATTASGGIRYKHYWPVGPAQQLGGYGWSIGQYGGTVTGELTDTLDGALLADTAGTGGTGTSVTLTDASLFPDSGTILVGEELITYTGKSGNDLTSITRGASGTATAGTSNGQAHSDLAVVSDASDYVGWGSAASGDFVIAPGMWSLDNYGSKLIALIVGSACFEWDADASSATSIRATRISGTPYASNDVLVSTPDRHLVFLGTQTTIDSDTTTNPLDKMFIRFSSQEDLNVYTPTATNTAGTQRLADGSEIRGALRGRDAIYIWTDTALFTMRFVGSPFTFAFEQAGTNCGLIGRMPVWRLMVQAIGCPRMVSLDILVNLNRWTV